MVTVEVDEQVWTYLMRQKRPGDSHNDVLRRELGLASEATPERSQRADTPAESGAVSRARDALADWDPANVDSAKARVRLLRSIKTLMENLFKNGNAPRLDTQTRLDQSMTASEINDDAARLVLQQFGQDRELVTALTAADAEMDRRGVSRSTVPSWVAEAYSSLVAGALGYVVSGKRQLAERTYDAWEQLHPAVMEMANPDR